MIQIQIKISKENRELVVNIGDFLTTKSINSLENCSDLFYQLKLNHHDKISDEELYDLARIIKLNFPNSEIEWINTFVLIESLNYLNAIESKSEGLETDIFENIEGDLDFSREKEVQNLYAEIRPTVAEKIFNKGL